MGNEKRDKHKDWPVLKGHMTWQIEVLVLNEEPHPRSCLLFRSLTFFWMFPSLLTSLNHCSAVRATVFLELQGNNSS